MLLSWSGSLLRKVTVIYKPDMDWALLSRLPISRKKREKLLFECPPFLVIEGKKNFDDNVFGDLLTLCSKPILAPNLISQLEARGNCPFALQ